MKVYAVLDNDKKVVALVDGATIITDRLLFEEGVSEVVAVGDAPCGLGWRWEGSVFSPPADDA